MIEVGDFVRTKDGYIFKILTKENTNYGYCGITDSNTKYTTYTYNKRSFNDIKNKIAKHSKNIIDLIEIGDYVNGLYIDLLEKDRIWATSMYGEEDIVFYENEIKTILTKELYQANCYTVERKKNERNRISRKK